MSLVLGTYSGPLDKKGVAMSKSPFKALAVKKNTNAFYSGDSASDLLGQAKAPTNGGLKE